MTQSGHEKKNESLKAYDFVMLHSLGQIGHHRT